MDKSDQVKPVIRIENLYKVFGKNPEKVLHKVHDGISKDDLLAETGHALGLQNINLHINPGEIFVIMGLSGSGKSTLIRHINRLIDPTAGAIFIDDVDVMGLSLKDLREFRRHRISMVFQRFGLLPHKTVEENVAFGLKIQGIKKDDRLDKARKWLVDVGLGGYEQQYPAQLSGGQQQRVGLARALCTDADILLMDEAFSALDPLIRSEMQDQLVELQEKLHKTIVFITHDLDEALRLGNRIAILRAGKVVQIGEPKDILLHPADDYVEAFVKDVNRARALTVDNVMKPPQFRITADTLSGALMQMKGMKSEYGYYVTDEGYQGVMTQESVTYEIELGTADTDVQSSVNQDLPTLSPDDLLENVLPDTIASEVPLPVVGADGELEGQLSRNQIVKVLSPD